MSCKVFHRPLLSSHSGFRVTHIVHRSNKWSEVDPSVVVVSSVAELLESNVDLVVIATPVSTHFTYTKLCLEAGLVFFRIPIHLICCFPVSKHVVVEKPFTNTVAEAQELTSLAADMGLKLSVFHNRRYDSDFLTLCDVLNQVIWLVCLFVCFC